MSKENPFSVSKQALILKPKTLAKEAFNYHGFADLKNLISFVGSTPKIDVNDKGDAVIMYRKKIIADNSIVIRDAAGNVTEVLDYEKAAEVYDIAAQNDSFEKATKK